MMCSRSILAFNFLRTMYVASDGEMLCDTLLQCFVETTTSGWRAGGGMGDVFGDSVTAERSGINAYAGAALFFMFFWCGGNTRKHAHHTHTQKHRLTHTRPFPAPAGLGCMTATRPHNAGRFSTSCS